MLTRLILLAALLSPSLAFGQTYWGDYQDADQTEYMYFPSKAADGTAVTLSSGTLACYENGSATQFTSGLTLDNDFDGQTGFHQIAVDFSDANFEATKTYTVILTGGTADGVAVAGSPAVTFSVGRYASTTSVIDDLLDRALSAVTAPPGSTPTVGEGFAWLVWLSQARIVTTGTLRTVYGDDGTTPIAEAVLDDPAPGTFEKGKDTAP